MRRLLNHPRLFQPTLFQAPPARPSFQTLPADIQAKTIQLLARLLCHRRGGASASRENQEADDE
jgi:hypothetical protein